MTSPHTLTKFAALYDEGFAPPKWSTTGMHRPTRAQQQACRVFYDAPHRPTHSTTSPSRRKLLHTRLLRQLQRLVYEREPVNIEMRRTYDKDALQRLYGHRTGAYARLHAQWSCGSITPANIVLYTPASVRLTHTPRARYATCHILHAIGLAFDSPTQRDYKLYAKHTRAKRIRHAIAFYERVFRKLYYAAKHLGLTTLVLSLVGANNFAKAWWYGGIDGFQAQVWAPAYANTQHLANGLDVCVMGANGSLLQSTFGWQDIGYFPACIEQVSDVSKTAFVNAWDCWSVPGNGNALDNSLDGFVGRVSNVGVLGNGMTNAWLMEDNAYVGVKSAE